jgi:2-keto-3-deoxy-L-fuconate dehydrogenase
MSKAPSLPKMSNSFAGKRVVVTQADDFMGPAITTAFEDRGADVFADRRDLTKSLAADQIIDEAGRVDILVVNLMMRNPRTSLLETSDEIWAAMFEAMVHPLHRLVRAVLPQMIARRSGKIVIVGSANGLRGSSPRAAYSAARGAQLSYVKSAGHEVARHNVNLNATAQNFVSNPTSYPPLVVQSPAFAERLADIPIGRVAEDWESAALVLFLASDESNFFFGQIFPFSGGWAV